MPFASRLGLTYVGVGRYALTEPLVYRGAHDTITVPADFVTDLASVPRPVRWLLPSDGVYTGSAVLHDFLCVCLAKQHAGTYRVDINDWTPERGWPQRVSARDTDGLFRRTMREAGVPLLRRWLLWTGVRWGAAANPARRLGWHRDAPLVLLFSLLSAPLIVPASVAVLLALAVYWVAEAAVSLLEVAR